MKVLTLTVTRLVAFAPRRSPIIRKIRLLMRVVDQLTRRKSSRSHHLKWRTLIEWAAIIAEKNDRIIWTKSRPKRETSGRWPRFYRCENQLFLRPMTFRLRTAGPRSMKIHRPRPAHHRGFWNSRWSYLLPGLRLTDPSRRSSWFVGAHTRMSVLQ